MALWHWHALQAASNVTSSNCNQCLKVVTHQFRPPSCPRLLRIFLELRWEYPLMLSMIVGTYCNLYCRSYYNYTNGLLVVQTLWMAVKCSCNIHITAWRLFIVLSVGYLSLVHSTYREKRNTIWNKACLAPLRQQELDMERSQTCTHESQALL